MRQREFRVRAAKLNRLQEDGDSHARPPDAVAHLWLVPGPGCELGTPGIASLVRHQRRWTGAQAGGRSARTPVTSISP
jgi:hypothetical protein